MTVAGHKTFDDDFARLNLQHFGAVNIPLVKLGLSWPPPERIVFAVDPDDPGGCREARDGDPPDAVLRRVSLSSIPDDVREGATNVCRGAEYDYEES